jgi:hypothetical protein
MKIKSIWLSLIVIICFLLVQIRYNSSPYGSIGLGLYALMGDAGMTFTADYHNYPLQFIIVAAFVITASLFEKKALVIAGIIMLMLLLCFWMYALYGIIDFSLLSIIPFAAGAVISIIILVKK